MPIKQMPTGTSPHPTSPVTLNGGTGSTNALKTITVSKVSSQTTPVTGTYTPQNGSQPGSANVRLSTTRWSNFSSQCSTSFTATITHQADNKITEFEPSSQHALMAVLHEIERSAAAAAEEARLGRVLMEKLVEEVHHLRHELNEKDGDKPSRPRPSLNRKRAAQQLRKALSPKA
jgi:hypothetical protein